MFIPFIANQYKIGTSYLNTEDGGDAEAIYSLEEEYSTYSGSAIRVVRGDSAESDIGFVNNKDLDESGLLNFSTTRLTGDSLVVNGTDSGYASTPDTADLDITGDIDIRAEVEFDDLTGVQEVLFKWQTDLGVNFRSYGLRKNTTNNLEFFWADNSNNLFSLTSTTTITASKKWIRVTFDVDNGAGGKDIKFYTSVDGTTWTQLGSTVTQTGTTSIQTSGSALFLGAISSLGGITNFLKGNIYKAIIKNGIDGTTVFNADFTTQTEGASSFVESTGKTVSITSTGGATVRTFYDQSANGNDATQTDVSKQPTIVTSGVLETVNGKPAISFDGVDNFLSTPVFMSASTNQWVFSVVQRDNNTHGGIFANGGGDDGWATGFGSGTFDSAGNEILGIFDAVRWMPTGYTTGTTVQQIITSNYRQNDMDIYQNGVEISPSFSGASATNAVGDFFIGSNGPTSRFLACKIQKIYAYPSDKSAVRADIETYINNSMNIY